MGYLRRTGRTHRGNAFDPLIDGEKAYQELLAGMSAAKKYIYLATWYLDPELELTRASSANPVLRRLLLDKARAGVEVKVLAWNQNIAVGPLGSLFHLFQTDLRAFQQALAAANPRSGSALRTPQNRHLPPGRHLRTGSHHQKFWVMDDGEEGAVGFVGGLNLGQHEWDTSEHRVDDPRRTSPGLDRKGAELLRLFDTPGRRALLRAEIERLLDEHLRLDQILNGIPILSHPTAKRLIKGWIVDHVIDYLEPFATRHDIASKIRGPAIAELLGEFRVRWFDAASALPTVATTKARAPRGSSTTVQLGHTSHLRGPGLADDIWRSYRHAVRMARQFIYFENQYFVSTDLAVEVARVLRRRPKVSFVLVLPNKAEDFLVGPAIANRQRVLLDLIRNAARKVTPKRDRVFVYTPMNWHAARAEYLGIYVHAKVGIIDDRWVTIGSANDSARSFEYDTELNAFLDDPAQATSFRKALWAEHMQVGEDDVKDVRKAVVAMKKQADVNDETISRGAGALTGRLTNLRFVAPNPWLRGAYELLAREFL